MRALAFACSVLVACDSLSAAAHAVLPSEPSIQLASTKGVRLFVTPDGEKPCDFGRERLLSDMEFVLNTAHIDFVEGVANGHSDWPILEAVLSSFDAKYTCVWSINISLSTNVNGTVLSKPYDGWVDLWTGGSFGVQPGNGLTARASEVMQGHLRDMINKIYESRKIFPQP